MCIQTLLATKVGVTVFWSAVGLSTQKSFDTTKFFKRQQMLLSVLTG